MNITMLLLTLFALVFVAAIWYFILPNILQPALAKDPTGMSGNLAYLIFPIFIIAIIVMIWLWAKPIVGV